MEEDDKPIDPYEAIIREEEALYAETEMKLIKFLSSSDKPKRNPEEEKKVNMELVRRELLKKIQQRDPSDSDQKDLIHPNEQKEVIELTEVKELKELKELKEMSKETQNEEKEEKDSKSPKKPKGDFLMMPPPTSKLAKPPLLPIPEIGGEKFHPTKPLPPWNSFAEKLTSFASFTQNDENSLSSTSDDEFNGRNGKINQFGLPDEKKGRKKQKLILTNEERKMRLRNNKTVSNLNDHSRMMFLAMELAAKGCEVEVVVLQHLNPVNPKFSIGEITYDDHVIVSRKMSESFIDYYTELVINNLPPDGEFPKQRKANRVSIFTELVMIYYLEKIFKVRMIHSIRKRATTKHDFSKEIISEYYDTRTRTFLSENDVRKIGKEFNEFLKKEYLLTPKAQQLKKLILRKELLDRFYQVYH